MTKTSSIGLRPGVTYYGFPGTIPKEAQKMDINKLVILQPEKCFEALRNTVCLFYGISTEEFHMVCRKEPIPQAKQLFCYLANLRLFREVNQSTIGNFIYNDEQTGRCYNRTNVIHAVGCVKAMLHSRQISQDDIVDILMVTNLKLSLLWYERYPRTALTVVKSPLSFIKT